MKHVLPFIAGIVVCCITILAVSGIKASNREDGSIANQGFATIEISASHLAESVILKTGESRNFPYGKYAIFIPELDRTVELFKNRDGSCKLDQVDNTLVVHTEGLASLDGP